MQAVYYFYVVVCILLLAFLESVREMQKFAERDQNIKVNIFECEIIFSLLDFSMEKDLCSSRCSNR